MVDTIELINKFISEIKKQFSNLHIGYEYNSETDEYNIWHNNRELEITDNFFLEYASKKAEEILFKNNVYNFYFGYDYYKSKELENKMNKYIFDIIEPKQIEYEYTEINNLPDYISNVETNIDLQLKMSSMKVNFDYVELKLQKEYFPSILPIESDLDFSDDNIFPYNEFREAS